ncbi:WD domain protein [Myotisia sp. PD_48]|nr:WD domain protein [Myotisia sp. PD_48]
MDDEVQPTKRRKLADGTSHSTDDASSDELGGTTDVERRRASWARYAQNQNYRSPQKDKPESSRPSTSEPDSPDELTEDIQAYLRRSQTAPRRHASRSRSISTTREAPSEGDHRLLDDGDDGDAGSEDNPDPSDDEDVHDSQMDSRQESPARDSPSPTSTPTPTRTRIPTPIQTPELLPQPERLNYKEKFILTGHRLGVSAVRFSPDGTADATIKIWSTSTGNLIHTFEGHLAGISTISWGPDSKTIASGSDDKSIRIWNVETGKPYPNPFLGHHNYVYSIAVSPKGNMLVSGSYDEAVFLWDVRSARIMRSLPAHSDPVAGVDIVRDGTLIVSCAGDGLIRVWDTASGQCLRTLVHEDNPPVTSVKFSPNGKYILAWTLDGCIRLWDYVEGRCIKTYQGHKNEKYSLTGGFGCYGQQILSNPHAESGVPVSRSLSNANQYAFAVSGSEDGSVLCWDVVSKKVLQKLEAHTDVVLGVDTFTPKVSDGRRLMVSCGLDKTVRVWEEIEDGPPNVCSQEQSNVNGEDCESENRESQDNEIEDHEIEDDENEDHESMSLTDQQQQPETRSHSTDVDSDGDRVMQG